MAIPKKIINVLDKNNIKYEPIEHKTVYTAYDKARTLKCPEKMIGKTLVLKMNGNLAFVLIAANKNLDKEKFKKVSKAKSIDFATERLVKNKIKGVKIGAFPPFGCLWKIPTFADKSFLSNTKIIINAGEHEWSLRITPAAFKKLLPDLFIGSFSKAKSK